MAFDASSSSSTSSPSSSSVLHFQTQAPLGCAFRRSCFLRHKALTVQVDALKKSMEEAERKGEGGKQGTGGGEEAATTGAVGITSSRTIGGGGVAASLLNAQDLSHLQVAPAGSSA